MDILERAKNKLIGVPFIVLIVVVLFLYIVGLFANQGNLIQTIETYRTKNVALEQQIGVLKKELQKKSQIFIPSGDNRCLTKPYVPEFYIISRTNEKDWCNIRTFSSNIKSDKGFDIFFPAQANIEMRGALAVFEERKTQASKTLFTVQEASAEAKQVGSYDSITMGTGTSASKFIRDAIVSKQIIRIHNQQVLFVVTKDTSNKKVEHYLIDNGNIPDKRVYKISFYTDLSKEQKNIVLNSFAPRFP